MIIFHSFSYSFFQKFFRNFVISLGIITVFSGFFPEISLAAGRLPTAWQETVQESEGLQVLKNTDAGSVEIIRILLIDKIVGIFKYIFIGVALLFMAMYSYMLALGMGEEDQFTEQRKNFLFAIIGFAILGLSAKIVEVIDPYKNHAFQKNIIDEQQAETVIQTVITYFEMGLGTIAIAVIFYGAIMMIMADGDEERSSSGKHILMYGFMGIAAVMLAEVLVNKVFYPASAIVGGGVGQAQATTLIQEGAGILMFALEFLAVGIFLGFLISGFLYLTAGEDEEQTEQAKRTLIWTVLGGLVVLASYGVLTFFAPGLQ